ncbi:MAG: choice-of-anchor B family protein, partial [Candidatus Eisenbacteria bacterium]
MRVTPLRLPIVWLTVLLAGLGSFVWGVGTALAQSEGVTLVSHYDMGNTYNDVWGYSAPDGTELAILGTVDGTYFVDVTDPTSPEQVGYVPGSSSTWRDMKTYGHYAYSVNETGGGIQVIDLADPRQPTLVNSRTAQFDTAHNIFIDEGAGTLWAVGANGGAGTNVFVYDLTADPSSPGLITSWGDAYLHDIFVRDGLAFGAAIYAGQLWILDVSALPDIRLLSQIATPGHFTHNTWLTEDGNYCLTTDEKSGGHIGVYDVSDPSAPRLVAEWTNPEYPTSIIHNAFVHGRFAYISWYTTGVQILDLANPSAPTRAGYYDTYPGTQSGFDGAWGVYPYARHGYVYVSDISTGLYVLRFDGARALVAGVVRDAFGAPVEDVAVRALGTSERTVTDAEGAFELRLLPGDYEIEFERFGWGRVERTIEVDQNEIVLDDVVLDQSPLGEVAGTVRDVNGQGIEGVRVWVVDTPFETRTDGNGKFAFDAVPEGNRVIEAEALGVYGEPTDVHVVGSGQAEVELVVFRSVFATDFEDVASGWTVGLPEDDATSGLWELAALDGAVDSAAQPTADHSADGTRAFVTEMGAPGSEARDHDVDNGSTTLVSPVFDVSGLASPVVSFELWYVNAIDLVPDDSFVVLATADGGTNWSEVFRTAEGAQEWRREEVVLPGAFAGASQLQLRFVASDLGEGSLVEAAIDDFEIYSAEGRIVGVAVPTESGQVTNGSVTLVGRGLEVPLGPDGGFELVAPAGEATVEVAAFGYETATRVVNVETRTTARESFSLVRSPHRTVMGRVLADDGTTPLAGAVLEFVGTPLRTTTGDDGAFELDVPLGEYMIHVTATDY